MQVSPANLYRLNYSYTGEYERNGNRAKGKRDARGPRENRDMEATGENAIRSDLERRRCGKVKDAGLS